MKRRWETDELVDHWTLLPAEVALLANKTGATRLGFGILLKSFQLEARFPQRKQDVPGAVVVFVAKQVGVAPEEFLRYQWRGRTIEYHRAQIRAALGFREATEQDEDALTSWLAERSLIEGRDADRLKLRAYERCRAVGLEPPAPSQVDRLVRSALRSADDHFCTATMQRLPPATILALEALLRPAAADGTTPSEAGRAAWTELKTDPGPPTLATVLTEVAKLERLRALELPDDLFARVPPKVLQAYRRRAAVEETYELRRHPAPVRLTLLAVFCWLRSRELADTLVDVLLQLIHYIGAKAERKVEHELLDELRRVTGKTGLLLRIAEASVDNPDGLVRDVVFPAAGGEQTLHDVVRELKARGPAYQHHVYLVMRNAYRSHYRRAVPHLLRALAFRSNNAVHRPVIRALALLALYDGSPQRFYRPEEPVPVDGVVPSGWRELVIEADSRGNDRINRITYELCVLERLREKVRCKEIWVVGADRYRNPDDDLPQDFDAERDAYYAALRLPSDADAFIDELRSQMADGLTMLDRGVPASASVKILRKNDGWIQLSPLEALPDPPQLDHLKAELGQRWPMTSLLDILKEADLRIGFTDMFKSPTAWEVLDRRALRKRLLLCLYGLGTNAGLKRMSGGQQGESYKDLLYVRRRFIDKEHLRTALSQVANATFRARASHIWGEATTACASDSKKFSAWDQNLLTEWHVRYRGPGIMIYWHVDKKACCIYSQVKSCSSSEVAAMIEGVLRHCTEMAVDKNYVDSHGQSEIGFAFSKILGFELLPRLKAIHAQKLYRPEVGDPDAYPHLQPVLTRSINWDLIRRQYDEMVKYATALRLGTAETEAILRRFTRNNVQHPTYRALAELGKALKTIFLCRYLSSETLRREIHEGLQVVENWNNTNDFIFYGKGGEIATNRAEDQELAALSLHLLQACLVFVNVLMLQQILTEPPWAGRMSPDDYRGLTPLVFTHVTPYGRFELNLDTRIPIESAA